MLLIVGMILRWQASIGISPQWPPEQQYEWLWLVNLVVNPPPGLLDPQRSQLMLG